MTVRDAVWVRGGRRLAIVAIIWAGEPSTAVADEASPTGPVRFTSLAPDGARSEIDGELVTGSLDADDEYTTTAAHLDAQYVVARGAGGYVRISAVHVGWQNFDDESGLGGVELGGFQRLRLARDVAVTGRVGLVLPATTENVLVGARHALEARRPSDLSIMSIDDAALRLAMTPMYTRGPVTARIDAGTDARLTSSSELADSTYHVDLAVGVQHRAATATLEFSTFGAFSDTFVRHALTLGMHYELRGIVMSARLGTPFTSGDYPYPLPAPDFDPYENLGDRLAFTLGVSVGL